jgi:hypothetical protein
VRSNSSTITGAETMISFEAMPAQQASIAANNQRD